MELVYRFYFILQLLLIIAPKSEAQSPEAIPYQAVARNATGDPLANETISVRFHIHDITANGTIVYSETHSPITNSLGLFSVNLGQGSILSGTFSTINWGTNAKFLEVGLDITGTNSIYTNMGTQQMLSVPYSLYSKRSGNIPDGTSAGNTMRWNGTVWIVDDAITNTGNNVGIGTATPNTSASLDLTSTSKGFLMPRMSTTQRNSIASPVIGLQIFNLDDQCVDIFDGTNWIKNCGLKISGSTLAPTGPGSNEWIQKSSIGLSTSTRRAGVGFTIGNNAYIGTGFNPGHLTDFWAYDPGTNLWSQKQNFQGGARYGATGFSIGTKGYLGTGFGSGYKKDFWEYNSVSNTWSPIPDFPGTARYFAVSFTINGKGYVGTGRDASNVYYNDLYEYTPGSGWVLKSPTNPPAIRYSAVSFSVGSKAYLGTGYDGVTFYNDFHEYDPISNAWTAKSNLTAIGRYGATGFELGGKGYLGTGSDGTLFYNDFWEFDPATNVWIQKANYGGSTIFTAVGFSIGGSGYIGSGLNIANQHTRDFWEYKPNQILPSYTSINLGSGGSLINNGTWTIDNNTIYNSNSGNVGIGTTTPNTKLEIKSPLDNILTLSSSNPTDVGSGPILVLKAIDDLSVVSTGLIGQIAKDIHFPYRTGALELRPQSRINFYKGNTTVGVSPMAMTILNSGNVGIGNVAPTATLDITGTLKFTDGNQGAGFILKSDAAGLASWVNMNTLETDPKVGMLTTDRIPKWNGSVLTDGLFVDNGTKIGLGTTSPLHNFHVHNGNILLTGGTSIGGPMILFGGGTTLTGPGADFNGMWGIEYEPTDGGLNFWKPNPNPSGFGNYFLFLANSGNIGIGTNIPSQKLDVYGTTRTTNFQMTTTPVNGHVLKSDANGNASWVAPSTLGLGSVTSIATGTGLTGGPITSTGTISLANSGVTAGTYTKLTVDAQGRATSGSALSAGDIPSLATSYIQNQIATDQTAGFRINGNGLFNGGNVGIGTTTPTEKLEINGNIKFTDNGEISSYSNYHRILFRRFEFKLEFREFGDIIFSPGSTTGLETSRMVFNANGNAGFGINSPQTKIHIDGGTDADFTNTSGYFTIGNNGTTNIVMDDNEIMARNNGVASRLFLQNSGGNVGINSNAAEPLAALDVNGTVKFGSAGTVLAAVIKGTGVTSSLFIAANTTTVETYSIPNTITSASILVSPSSSLINGIVIAYARVSTPGTVEVSYRNTTGAGITLNSGTTLFITAIQ